MPRTARSAPGKMVYHVLNRGVGKNPLFFSDDDYLAFERVIADTLEKRPMRILSYCLMPNHWHFVLWPEVTVHGSVNGLNMWFLSVALDATGNFVAIFV